MGRSYKVLKLKHTAEELKIHYQKCNNSVERRRTQVIWLLTEGKEHKEVQTITAYSDWSIRDVVSRYNKKGLLGLKNKNKCGAPEVLTEQEQLLLTEALDKTPSNKGRWNGRKIAIWVRKNLDKDISLVSCYNYLHKLKFSLQQPRPRHKLANEVEQEEFKKTTYLNVWLR